MEAKPASLSRTDMVQLVMPTAMNHQGSLFGGQLVAWIDACAAVTARRHVGDTVVTASMERIDFLAPVHLGDIVNLHGIIHWTGRTSMEVGVDAYVESLCGERRLAARAILTFVALHDGKPIPVPPLIVNTPEEQEMFAAAAERAAVRRARRNSQA